MASNAGLSKAKDAKKDEFYTAYEDIQIEINHYEEKFKDKTVLCNCDDPFESNFCKFFLRNFNYLGLKRLICTSYGTSPVIGQQLTIFDMLDEPVVRGNGYVMDITSVPMSNGRGVSDADIDALLKSKRRGVKRLKGDGDFRSDECIEYLKQADIVVTNPPFSLFREYVSQLMTYGKQFLIIGNVNAITYKEIFPLIKDNKLWLGASIHSGDRKFYVPDDYPLNASGCGVESDGRKYIRVKGVRWFTNIDYAMRHEKLILFKKYYGNEEEYPHYDNYDAINVDKTSDIPCDYFEDMGVPITYLDKHNPEQFDIVRFRKGDDDRDLTYSIPLDSDIDTCLHSVNVERERERERESTQACGRPLTSELSSVARCNGIMGVPITFLDKFNPDQFEIVGATESEGKGFSRGLWIADSGVAQPLVAGERRYKRLFIKLKM